MAPVFIESDSSSDIWRKIPPEEKLELMAQAQSSGVLAGIVLVAVAGTMAVGLKVPWLFWSAFLGIPFVFQFASAKKWRDLKPRTMLEYLAARSAARRYAYSAHSKDLSVSMLFKGTLQRQFQVEEVEEQLAAKLEQKDRIEVWVALFRDTVVMISERKGGAGLEFAHLIDERMTVEAHGFDSSDDERHVLLNVTGRDNKIFQYKLESRHPAALLVFERKSRQFMIQFKESQLKEKAALVDPYSSGSSLVDFDPQQSF